MAVGPDTTPTDLRRELKRIESDFTLDTAMLKKTTKRFGEELREGWRNHNRIWCVFPTHPAPKEDVN